MAKITTVEVFYSAAGMIKLATTVRCACYDFRKAGQKVVSTQDLMTVINESIKETYNKVTEKQVQTILNTIARDNAKGERYSNDMGNVTVVKVDGYWYNLNIG